MLCERRQSEEGKEGMNCFFNKSKPSWVHYHVYYKHVNTFPYDLPYGTRIYSRKTVRKLSTKLDTVKARI